MILHGLLSQTLARPWSPSADLLVANALGASPGLRRPAPTVFETDDAVLVVRHDLGARIRPDRRPEMHPDSRRLIYLLDDDVFAALRDPGLPWKYRLKLRLVEAAAAKRFLRQADQVVVSCKALADVLRPRVTGEIATVQIHWAGEMPGVAHFDDNSPLRIACLGSLVHRAELAFLLPVIERILQEVPDVEIWLPGNHALPDPLAGHRRIRRIEATAWPAYRTALAGLRYHLALYPLLDTAVNRSRSANKIIEHAIAGAAGVYSAPWPEGARIRHGSSGLVLANDPEIWGAEVVRALHDRARLARLSAGAQAIAADLNDPTAARRFWRAQLGLADPPAAI